MRDADVDQPRLFAPGHDLDRKTERRLRLFQKRRRVLGHAQRIGADCAHGVTVEPAQPLAETMQALERALLRFLVEPLVARQPRAELDRLAQGVERIDLVADDAADLQMEGVGTEIDGGE